MGNKYRWLNVRGLPTDAAADYAPPGGHRVVIGEEWFGVTDALSSGTKLDIKTGQISSDVVTVNLVDRNRGARAYYLREIFQSEPQESVLITGQAAGGGWEMSTDITTVTPQSLWTILGECVRCTAKSTDSAGRTVYTLTRNYNDTEFVTGEDAVLRPGMRLYKYPLLNTLFVELWEYDKSTGESTQLYVGNLQSVAHNPNGLNITLRIQDIISGSTLPKVATITLRDDIVPGPWNLSFSYEDMGGISNYRPTFLLIPSTTPKLFDKSAFNFSLLVCKSVQLRRDDYGFVSCRITWTPGDWGLSRNGIGVSFRYTDIVGYSDDWTLDADSTVSRFTLPALFNRNEGQDKEHWIEFRYTLSYNRINVSWPPFYVPLKRDQELGEINDSGRVGKLFGSQNGFNEMVQTAESNAAVYWAAFDSTYPTVDPISIYGEGEDTIEVDGIYRCDIVGKDPTTPYADWVSHGFADIALCPRHYWPGAKALTENLPYGGSYAYLMPETNRVAGIALSDIITGGRVDTVEMPPFKGLGVPDEYTDIDAPALEGLAVSGWGQFDNIREWLQAWTFITSAAIGCDVTGKIKLAGYLRAPGDGQYVAIPTISLSDMLKAPTVSTEIPSASKLIGKLSNDVKIVMTALESQSADELEFAMPEFVSQAAATEFLARMLPIVSRPRQTMTVEVFESDLSSFPMTGSHVQLTGDIPGNPYNSDTLDNYALVTSVKRQIFAGKLVISLLLLPEYTTTFGYHWGSPVEAYDGSNLWVQRQFGADFGTIFPPGVYDDDTEVRLYDNQGRLDDYFEVTPDSREAKNGEDCYKLSASYIASAPATRGLHPVTAAGVDNVTIAGDYRDQIRKHMRILSSGGSATATVSDVTYSVGFSTIYADWATVPAVSDFVWSESIQMTTDTYSTDPANSQRHYYYDSPTNAAIDIIHAPGARVWEVTGFNLVAKTITVSGDIRPDLPDVSGSDPVYLDFLNGLLTAGGDRLEVDGISYSSPSTTLSIDTMAAGIAVGDKFRDYRQGGGFYGVRDGSVNTYYYK